MEFFIIQRLKRVRHTTRQRECDCKRFVAIFTQSVVLTLIDAPIVATDPHLGARPSAGGAT
jgi:hypothetical protein